MSDSGASGPNLDAEQVYRRLFKWTSSVIEKWRTVGIGEEDAAQLMYWWGGMKRVTTSADRNRKVIDATAEIEWRGGLGYPAVYYGKAPRTIRRWCEQGFFPSAWRTSGGHWRVPPNAVREAERHLPLGYTRGPKNLLKTSAWKEFKREFIQVFCEAIPMAVEIEASAQNLSQEEFLSAVANKSRAVRPSSNTFDILARAHQLKSLPLTRLRSFARRVQMSSPEKRLTAVRLARALGVSLSTLYRRFGTDGLRVVIAGAHRSHEALEEDRDPHADDADSNTIATLFSECVQEFTLSPRFRARELDDHS